MSETATVAGLADLLRSWLGPEGEPAGDGELSSSARLPLARSYGDGGEEPGRYPFTRGRTEIGYRDELWVMGQYSGYGTPQETNARFKRLLEAGQSGLSVALDLPTQMGLDSDHPQADGEVGKVGTPLDTVDDLIALLDGLPLENVRQIRTTANAIGPIFAAFVFVALEELGRRPRQRARDAAERPAQGVLRARHVHLPAGRRAQTRGRRRRARGDRDPSLGADRVLRLPRPRLAAAPRSTRSGSRPPTASRTSTRPSAAVST